MRSKELRNEIKDLWIKACNHQGIDEDEKFVCFELDNPFLIKYDKKMKLYQKLQRQEFAHLTLKEAR